MNSRSDYWMEIAQYDLDTADAMLQTGRYLYVGFMCHQVAEKTLKAVIASKNLFPPKTHHLVDLANRSGIFDLMTDEQKTLLRELNPLNIEARYPAHIEAVNQALNHEKCTSLLNKTREWYNWIKKLL